MPRELLPLGEPERTLPAHLHVVVEEPDDPEPDRREHEREPRDVNRCAVDRVTRGSRDTARRCITIPPIVGVPIFSRWVCGPSSRIRWPHPHARNARIASGRAEQRHGRDPPRRPRGSRSPQRLRQRSSPTTREPLRAPDRRAGHGRARPRAQPRRRRTLRRLGFDAFSQSRDRDRLRRRSPP